jgi:hypothetical protein
MRRVRVAQVVNSIDATPGRVGPGELAGPPRSPQPAPVQSPQQRPLWDSGSAAAAGGSQDQVWALRNEVSSLMELVAALSNKVPSPSPFHPPHSPTVPTRSRTPLSGCSNPCCPATRGGAQRTLWGLRPSARAERAAAFFELRFLRGGDDGSHLSHLVRRRSPARSWSRPRVHPRKAPPPSLPPVLTGHASSLLPY